jgi:hypothetical protein
MNIDAARDRASVVTVPRRMEGMALRVPLHVSGWEIMK